MGEGIKGRNMVKSDSNFKIISSEALLSPVALFICTLLVFNDRSILISRVKPLILKMKALQYLETSKLYVQRHTITSLQEQNLQQHLSEDPKSHISSGISSTHLECVVVSCWIYWLASFVPNLAEVTT
jgi:hypothetical protein